MKSSLCGLTMLCAVSIQATVITDGSLNFIHGYEAANSHLNFNFDRLAEHSFSVPKSGSALGLLASSLGLIMCCQILSAPQKTSALAR